MSSQVLLYTGAGAGPFCTKALKNQLDQVLDKKFHILKEISSFPNYFPDPSSIGAVCVPGGSAATMFVEMTDYAKGSLKELFNKYTSSYYGACAGGILASNELFETYTPSNGPDLQSLPNGVDLQCFKPYSQLGIFPGKTIGPLFPKPKTGKLSLTDFRLININLIGQVKSTFPSVHILSPGYLDVDQIKGAEILSSYSTSFMTIRSVADKGMLGSIVDQKTFSSESLFYQSKNTRMVLTGSHPEIDSTAAGFELFKRAFSATSLEQENIVKQMQPDVSARQNCMKKNFETLGLHCVGV
jgi:glutamine amidotransferase-like uncharacterized protein